MKFIEFIFSGFFIWLGFMIMLGGIGAWTLQIIHKLIRAKTIKKMGYPPKHCDGDGDKYQKESNN